MNERIRTISQKESCCVNLFDGNDRVNSPVRTDDQSLLSGEDPKFSEEFCETERVSLLITPQEAIRQAIDEYIHYLCKNPINIQQIINKIPVDGPPQVSTQNIFFNLSLAHIKQISEPFRIILKIVHNFIYHQIKINETEFINLCDIMFIIKIGTIRDWKKNCCICKAKNIGDPNGWGGSYCKISIFRPCGHSICTKCIGKIKKCPICKTYIDKFIDPNDAFFSEEIINNLTKEVLNELIFIKHPEFASGE